MFAVRIHSAQGMPAPEDDRASVPRPGGPSLIRRVLRQVPEVTSVPVDRAYVRVIVVRAAAEIDDPRAIGGPVGVEVRDGPGRELTKPSAVCIDDVEVRASVHITYLATGEHDPLSIGRPVRIAVLCVAVPQLDPVGAVSLDDCDVSVVIEDEPP